MNQCRPAESKAAAAESKVMAEVSSLEGVASDLDDIITVFAATLDPVLGESPPTVASDSESKDESPECGLACRLHHIFVRLDNSRAAFRDLHDRLQLYGSHFAGRGAGQDRQ